MPKKASKNTKSGTVVVKGTITKEQEEILEDLVGLIGSNKQDVVGKIITLWLYNEGFLNKAKGEGKNAK